jgi:prepilin-type N-terminal cleavage/methylation domain-containing protein
MWPQRHSEANMCRSGSEWARLTGQGRATAPSGYTLTEMMIVLAVLATVAAIGWPALMRPWSRSRVQQAAQKWATQLLEARTRAVADSHVYRLRWRAGSGEFLIDTPSEQAAVALAHDPQTAFDPLLSTRPTPFHLAGILEEGVHFQHDGSPTLLTSIDTHVPPSDDQIAWSDPIWFYPDGRTSNGRWKLVAADGYQIDVVLRGLTGTVRTGAVYASPPAEDDLAVTDSAAMDPADPATPSAQQAPSATFRALK